MTNPNIELLIGKAQSHLIRCWSGALVHADMLSSLERLNQRARDAGFELTIASSFRDFDRQTKIWQEKIDGTRPVYGTAGQLLDAKSLADDGLLSAILRWSALPGVSRHHWGTDFDFYDTNAIDQHYQLELVPQEYEDGGPFYELTQWLRRQVEKGDAEGFFFPYREDKGGVAPEPWHLSHGPTAGVFETLWSFELFMELLDSGVWPLEVAIRSRAKEIYHQYVAPAVGR